MKSPIFTLLAVAAFSFSGQSIGSASPQQQLAAAHAVGGRVTGLSGSIVLQNNGGDDLTVNQDGDFIFAKPVPEGGDYNVTILTQPTNQTCRVNNGQGKAHGDVNSVAIVCGAGPQKMPS